MEYPKASKYPDLDTVYSQCSGPGALKLAEFIADKLDLRPGTRLLDVGTNRGYQTCFLAKEYGAFVVGIDPGNDRHEKNTSHVEFVMRNARSLGVQNRVLGVAVGVPETKFADASFDAAYSTTTLEMIRGFQGEDRYRECLAEVLRMLRPGGLFGYGDPMHVDVDIPADLVSAYTTGEGAGPASFAKSFATLDETVDAFTSVGFEIVEAGLAPDAWPWWDEYCRCGSNEDEARIIRTDGGRWISFGYVIARKAEETGRGR